MPLISVILPTYNTEEYLLRRSINSVLKQEDFSDFEIILIDDGSDEVYKNSFKTITDLDTRIKFIEVENGGVSRARNLGIDHSKGEYITFLDADDEIAPFFFKSAYKIANNYNSDFVIGGVVANDYENIDFYKYVGDELEISQYDNSNKENLKPNLIGNILRFEDSDGYIGRGPWSRLVKRELAEQVKFDTNLIIGEDVEWNVRLLDASNKICVVNQVWYWYYQNSVSALHRYNEDIVDIVLDELECLIQYIDFSKNDEFKSYINRFWEEIGRINNQYLSHEKCNLKQKEKENIYKKIYIFSAANQILSNFNYYRIGSWKQAIRGILFKMRIYFKIFN